MIIVWHDLDLRLEDHSALYHAVKDNHHIVPLWIVPEENASWADGEASRWWLYHSVQALSEQYRTLKGRLILKKGDPLRILKELIKELPITAIYYEERFEPHVYHLRTKISEELFALGVEVKAFPGRYLIDPRSIHNKTGKPYCVFTPFYNCVIKSLDLSEKPFKAPKEVRVPVTIASEPLERVAKILLPKHRWYKKLEKYWEPGKAKAHLSHLKKILRHYVAHRDVPSLEGTSKLSPYLHFGEISVRTLVYELYQEFPKAVIAPFVRQLIWREFANYLLFHFPIISEEHWKTALDKFSWKRSKKDLIRWQQGNTGYPIVDAGMRELWQTGWMHNRVRMIVASFLIKDLHIHWKEGARWFWDTLVDADLPNNSMNWQWIAGSGPDASPFFRIFNPTAQGEKFDPEGKYIRRYIPELKDLPNKWIHAPWEAPEEILEERGIVLGKTYPYPMVDHDLARKETLAVYKKHVIAKKS